MKVTLHTGEITLLVGGQEMTFSEKDLIAIVKEHLESKTSSKASIAERPTEEKWFEVKLQSIDQGLFKERRTDKRQEETRQLILEAFAEVKANPEKYDRNFKTMMPKRDCTHKTVGEFKKEASQLGGHIADWVEQALEWAQRIANGETWKSICNDPDTANWYRLVTWQDGYFRIVGGSCNSDYNYSASSVNCNNFWSNDILVYTVPLVVYYEK